MLRASPGRLKRFVLQVGPIVLLQLALTAAASKLLRRPLAHGPARAAVATTAMAATGASAMVAWQRSNAVQAGVCKTESLNRQSKHALSFALVLNLIFQKSCTVRWLNFELYNLLEPVGRGSNCI